MQDGISATLEQVFNMSTFEIRKQPVCLPKDGLKRVMKKYLIEREIPKIGTCSANNCSEAAARSNQVLCQLGPDLQWVEPFLSPDKMFYVYPAEDETLIHQHARVSEFPASTVSEISKTVAAHH
jgi:hypothetical protein